MFKPLAEDSEEADEELSIVLDVSTGDGVVIGRLVDVLVLAGVRMGVVILGGAVFAMELLGEVERAA